MEKYDVTIAIPVYNVFYYYNEYGYTILRVLSLVSIIFSLQLVINMILQGMKKYKLIYINTIAGIVINTFFDIPIILFLNKLGVYPYIGTLISTMLGQGVSILIVLISLKKEYKFHYSSIFKIFVESLLLIILIAVIEFILYYILFILFKTNNYFINLIYLAISFIISMGVYVLISYKSGMLYKTIGKKNIEKVLSKFKKKV